MDKGVVFFNFLVPLFGTYGTVGKFAWIISIFRLNIATCTHRFQRTCTRLLKNVPPDAPVMNVVLPRTLEYMDVPHSL